jgi:hypothetical protein
MERRDFHLEHLGRHTAHVELAIIFFIVWVEQLAGEVRSVDVVALDINIRLGLDWTVKCLQRKQSKSSREWIAEPRVVLTISGGGGVSSRSLVVNLIGAKVAAAVVDVVVVRSVVVRCVVR